MIQIHEGFAQTTIIHRYTFHLAEMVCLQRPNDRITTEVLTMDLVHANSMLPYGGTVDMKNTKQA